MEIHARLAGTRRIPPSKLLTFDRADVRGEDFSGRKLAKFSATSSRFRACRFEQMKIEDAGFGGGWRPSEYVDCSFDRSQIRAVAPGVARFVRCSFRDVKLREWICQTAEFIDCVFTGRGEELIFYGSVPADLRDELRRATNEFCGNDFAGMELTDCEFRCGVDLTRQVLPEGNGYLLLSNPAGAIAAARREVSTWEDEKRRKEALTDLRVLATEVEWGQEQLFLHRDDFLRLGDRKAAADLFALLQAAAGA